MRTHDEQIRERAGEQGVSADGIDRRGFLKCMAWAGTGLVWTFAGGVPTSRAFGESVRRRAAVGLYVCADQRQPHRLQQAGEYGRDRNAAEGAGEDRCGSADVRIF